MMVVLTDTDLSKLKQASRADIMSVLLRSTEAAIPSQNQAEGFPWEEVVDLTPDQVEEFVQGCAPQTVAGLKVIAEHGPVIAANLLVIRMLSFSPGTTGAKEKTLNEATATLPSPTPRSARSVNSSG